MRNPTIAAVAVVLSLGAAGAALAIADSGAAARGRAFTKVPTTILSASDRATISWQVRSPGNVRLRLYRGQLAGEETLVNEVTTKPGVACFEFVDADRPPGSAVYVLRVLGGDGRETTLGSALCVESKFAPSDVSSTAGSFQPAWTREMIRLPDPRSALLEDRFVARHHGLIPAPEPPIPR